MLRLVNKEIPSKASSKIYLSFHAPNYIDNIYLIMHAYNRRVGSPDKFKGPDFMYVCLVGNFQFRKLKVNQTCIKS